MLRKFRQEQILNILNQQGYVTVRYLADVLQSSTATVNRDLNAMQVAGLVKRSYGGVETVAEKHFPPLLQRQFYHKREKRRIAELAVEQIQNGDTVFLDGSTTVQYMVPFLSKKKDLTVITNSLRLAMELGELGFDVLCLGGHIIEHPYVLGGEETVENAMRYHPDKMFFSVGYVTSDGLVGSAHYLLYKTMLKNSTRAWFLTDRTKLTPHTGTSLCDFSVLTGVISDFSFPEETRRHYADVKFIVTE